MTRPYGRLFSGQDLFPGGFTPPYSITLPTFLDTTRPDMSAYTPVVVSTEAQLASAWTAADLAGGGVIHIALGSDIVTWTPSARTTSGWIVIEPENTAGYDVATGTIRLILDAGTRMDPTTGSNLPTFSLNAADVGAPAVTIPSTVHHVRFRSLAWHHDVNATSIGSPFVLMSDDAHDIVLEQVYMKQDPNWSINRAILLAAHHSAVIDSWIDAGSSHGAEAQSICFWSNQGVVKIVNNYMTGLGETCMIGGAQPTNPSDATLTYYPKDLEFRRNHLHHKKRYWQYTQDWADYWPSVRTGLTVGSVSGTTLTLSAGTFDTTQKTAVQIKFYAYVTAGTAVGSYADISAYADTSTVTTGTWYGTAPAPGDTIEVRKGLRYFQKNLFEFKNIRRAYVAENVMEGHWDDGLTQYVAVIFKSVNQSSGAGIYSQTSDVCFYDNLLFGVNGGTTLARAPEQPCLDMVRVHYDNDLFIGHGLTGARQVTMQFNGDTYHMSRVSFFRFGERAALIIPDDGNADDTFDRCIFATRDTAPYGWWTDTMSADPVVGFPASFDTATSSLTNCGITSRSYNTSHLNNGSSMTGNIAMTTEAALKLINPTTDFWGVADWGLDATSPLRDASGAFGVDYADLKARTTGVRASEADAPMDDWQVNGIVGTGVGTADHLALAVQPSGAVSGHALTTQPSGTVQDADDATVTSDTSTVSVAWVPVTGDAELSGDTSVSCSAGAFGFTDLALTWTVASQGRLRFSRTGLADVDSDLITLAVSNPGNVVQALRRMRFCVMGSR